MYQFVGFRTHAERRAWLTLAILALGCEHAAHDHRTSEEPAEVRQSVVGPIVKHEAEAATAAGVQVLSGRGASGGSYADFQNASGDYVEWTLSEKAGGIFKLSFAYQLAGATDRPLQLSVNGKVAIASAPFPNTGSWDTWSSIGYQVALAAGVNTVRLSAIGQSGPNLDFMTSQYLEPLTPSTRVRVNFGDALTSPPAGYVTDSGHPYGDRGDGQTYGWLDAAASSPINLTTYGRNRAPTPDVNVVRETLLHFDHPSPSAPNGKWELSVPNGQYQVLVQLGDVSAETRAGTFHLVRAEGTLLANFSAPVGASGVRNGVGTATVTDGRLTLDSNGGVNTKIEAVIVESLDGARTAAVLGALPGDGAVDVKRDTTISANFLHLPNQSPSGVTSLNNATVNSSTVKLFKVAGSTATPVAASVNGTGGGDAINLTPAQPLDANTTYRFDIDGVEDLAGIRVLRYTAEFQTGTEFNVPDPGGLENVRFDRRDGVAQGAFSTLVFGPDGKLYGMAFGGAIHRWTVAPDGSLTNEEVLSEWFTNYTSRLAIGLVFDPSSTAGNLIAYTTHSTFTDLSKPEGPDWDGKLSRISGPNLEQEQLLITNLPRSVRDHLTNSIAFRPGEPNALYFLQGSNSAGGLADSNWGNRGEHLLSAALLRLDLSKLPATLPLDAQTSTDQAVINAANINSNRLSDGTYNPYYTGAALTFYATGIRNAYDLVWHSNGQLYIPTNGTAAPSSSPASVAGTRRTDGSSYAGPTVPALTGNPSVQRDFLFRVSPSNPRGYYGHPNPRRGEYVLNRGPLDSSAYPSTLQPDANYRGFAYDFGFNISPNGVLEYRSHAFSGALRGALLCVRYSGGSDIIVLLPNGSNGDVATASTSVPGLSGFTDPLDIVENPANGDVYVADVPRDGSKPSQIVLLRPRSDNAAGATLRLENMTKVPGTGIGFPADDYLAFSRIRDVTNHRYHSENVVRFHNTGTQPLVIGGLNITGQTGFTLPNAENTLLPLTVQPGASRDVLVRFQEASGSKGLRTATLSLTSNASNLPAANITLRGAYMVQPEGGNEIDVQQTINAFGFTTSLAGQPRPSSSYPLPHDVASGAHGDIIVAEHWERADATLPVRALRLAAFKGPGGATMRLINSSGGTVAGFSFDFGGDWHQSLLPRIGNNSTQISFDSADIISGTFRLSSADYTTSGSGGINPSTGLPSLLGLRTYFAKNRNGDLIPNHYIMIQDYIGAGCGAGSSNCDWNDNVVYFMNIKPTGSFVASPQD